MTALLSAEKLSFAYQDELWLFKDVDFCLRAGEIVGLMGPSGCGKSTFGYCLSGIIPHIYQGNMQGKVFLEGKDISSLQLCEIAQKLGVVFQDPDTQLFSSTLEDDVVFGPENLCRSWPEMDAALRRSLAATNMTEHRLRNPKTLSGGQAQLAALSAVLALDPRILIFDEAMSHLDQKGVLAVQECVLSLKKQGCGIIMIEHEMERLQITDRILYLSDGILKEESSCPSR